jgi:hypothetical protein
VLAAGLLQGLSGNLPRSSDVAGEFLIPKVADPLVVWPWRLFVIGAHCLDSSARLKLDFLNAQTISL